MRLNLRMQIVPTSQSVNDNTLISVFKYKHLRFLKFRVLKHLPLHVEITSNSVSKMAAVYWTLSEAKIKRSSVSVHFTIEYLHVHEHMHINIL